MIIKILAAIGWICATLVVIGIGLIMALQIIIWLSPFLVIIGIIWAASYWNKKHDDTSKET